MTSVIERAREWWRSRAPRERAVFGGGGAALLLAVLWAYVWAPIEADRARLVAALPQLRAQAEAVTRESVEVDRLRTAARGRGAAAAPEAAIEEAMKSAGFGDALVGVALLGEGRVQVNLRTVPFDALVRVVADLAESHGVAVESAALTAAGEPGKVQVETLVLRAARGG